jgi:hypothetical protein
MQHGKSTAQIPQLVPASFFEGTEEGTAWMPRKCIFVISSVSKLNVINIYCDAGISAKKGPPPAVARAVMADAEAGSLLL